ncbi:hypothetical protein V866_004041 [Kwoniella sp. B9012]|uniref:Uncharacterized protein n=1 Tax=Kwoniella europaea PYCC6329 TaxID=1423913 RepID=A0AAX4KJZ1_9TREE
MTEYSSDPNNADLPGAVVEYVRERGGVWRLKVAQGSSSNDLSNASGKSDSSAPGGTIATQQDSQFESEPVLELIQEDGTPAVPQVDMNASVDSLKEEEWLMINGTSPGEFEARSSTNGSGKGRWFRLFSRKSGTK